LKEAYTCTCPVAGARLAFLLPERRATFVVRAILPRFET
jgi:hypothetical protein